MAKWYVKELSKLTDVSVQTLHHYDKISLLSPSVRQANGYRLYSEKDLLKLQQIIALKFFGFELSLIKTLLDNDVSMIDHFSMQAQYLEEKAKTLHEASKALKTIVAGCRDDKLISWETIIKLIEVYRMTQQLEKTWAGKVLNQEELKQYVKFEQGLKEKFSPEEEKKFVSIWDDIIDEINANLQQDPTSEFGIALGRRCMEWVDSLYGKQNINLRNSIWEKGFKSGDAGSEHNMTPEAVKWLDTAVEAYYQHRVMDILSQFDKRPLDATTKLWQEVLNDMFGDRREAIMEFYDFLFQDETMNPKIKQWLVDERNILG